MTPPISARVASWCSAVRWGCSALAFVLPALVSTAQPAMQTIANQSPMPLRNIQIDVRQVQGGTRELEDAQGEARLQWDAGGSASASARLRLGQQQAQTSGTVAQQVLVLNGRSAAIALRSSTPFRLMQTRFSNGRAVLVQGTVLLDATTGFSATPRWDGTDQAELELAASQAGLQSSGMGDSASTSSGSVSTLILPLGEWVTVAHSEQASSFSGRDGGERTNASARQHYELQVRLTVR